MTNFGTPGPSKDTDICETGRASNLLKQLSGSEAFEGADNPFELWICSSQFPFYQVQQECNLDSARFAGRRSSLSITN